MKIQYVFCIIFALAKAKINNLFKYVIICCAVFTLSSCSISYKRANTLKLINKIDCTIKKQHNLKAGYLIALYNLHDHNANRLYNPYIKKIINDEPDNKLYISQLQKKTINPELVNKIAHIKMRNLQENLLKLDKNYNFLSSNQLLILKTPFNHQNIMNRLQQIDKMIKFLPLMTPMQNFCITSHYGLRKKLNHRKKIMHKGIDLACRKNCDIYSAAEGVAVRVGKKKCYGKFIDIKHSKNLMTRYAHLNDIYIKEGSKILQGQAIGSQGKTGNATGEHLHFEILLHNKQINPYYFLLDL